MRFRKIFIVIVLLTLLIPISVQAKPPESHACNFPASDAESLEILSNYYPGYWWDHTNLTIAVQAHPSATQAQLNAINSAIATWSSALNSPSLDEIFRVSDRVTVLKDRKLVFTKPIQQTSADDLITAMVGRQLERVYPPKAQHTGTPVLSVKNLGSGTS